MEEYCDECDRYFPNEHALQQHLDNSSRHIYSDFTYVSGSVARSSSTAPARPSTMTPSTPLFGGSVLFGRVDQTVKPRDTAGDDTNDTIDTSKILMDSLKGLHSSGEYSDLVISCRGSEHQVHRAIVCTQSDFFSAACRGSFKEAQEGKIDLPDDDPRLVHIMVHYLYHFDYDLEKDGSKTDADEPAGGALLTHAKIYALAEKYLIHGLKAIALRQFKAAAARLPDIDDFLQAAGEVYESTMEDDRGLRDVVVKTLCDHSEWLDKKKVRDVVKGLGALTYDMVIHMRKKRIF